MDAGFPVTINPKPLYVACASIVLTACGGGGDGGGGVSNQELLDDRVALREELRLASGELTSPDSPNIPGTADFVGVAAAGGGIVNPDDGTSELRNLFFGEMTLSVDFENGSLTGEATNFVEIAELEGPVAGADASGTLDITGLRLADPDMVSFGVVVDGRIDGSNDAFLDFEDLPAVVTAFGTDAQIVAIEGRRNGPFEGQPGFQSIGGAAER